MALQTPESSGANGSHREELKVWNCTNCRRRKVRCDRRHPCAPCIRNKAECVFPVSGRMPRRGRDGNQPRPFAHKDTMLLGRLRRLEAMVSSLSSQVEHVEAPDQTSHHAESLTSAPSTISTASSEMGSLDHQVSSQNQSISTDQHSTRERVQTPPSTIDLTPDSQPSDESGDVFVADNGELVVGHRFWTVFCNEVCLKSAIRFTLGRYRAVILSLTN